MPLCQDTGLCVVFLEVGQDVHLVGGDLEEAVNEGVRTGYTEVTCASRPWPTRRGPQEHRRQHAGDAPYQDRPGRPSTRHRGCPRAAARRT